LRQPHTQRRPADFRCPTLLTAPTVLLTIVVVGHLRYSLDIGGAFAVLFHRISGKIARAHWMCAGMSLALQTFQKTYEQQ
jgi:hypothetical protein